MEEIKLGNCLVGMFLAGLARGGKFKWAIGNYLKSIFIKLTKKKRKYSL